MKFKKLLTVLLLFILGYISSAEAFTVGVDSSTSVVNLGEKGRLAINFDFDSNADGYMGSLGGTFRLGFSSNAFVSNPSFEFSNNLLAYGIDTTIAESENNHVDVTFLVSGFFATEGIKGKGILGFISFDTIAKGSAELNLADVFGGFSAFVPLGDEAEVQGITYNETTVQVVSTVPVPAAGWLFFSGLVFLARRKK